MIKDEKADRLKDGSVRHPHSYETEIQIVDKCNDLMKVISQWKTSSWLVRKILARLDDELDRGAIVGEHEFKYRR